MTPPGKIRQAAVELPINEEIVEAVRDQARKLLGDQAAEVERRILAGENRIELPYIPGSTDDRRIVYSVPRWRRGPRARLQVEVARLRHRYRQRQTRWGGAAPAEEPMQLQLVSGDPPDTLELTGTYTTHTAYGILHRWKSEMFIENKPVGSPVRCFYRGPDGVRRLVSAP
jgi:hypothetical protein